MGRCYARSEPAERLKLKIFRDPRGVKVVSHQLRLWARREPTSWLVASAYCTFVWTALSLTPTRASKSRRLAGDLQTGFDKATAANSLNFLMQPWFKELISNIVQSTILIRRVQQHVQHANGFVYGSGTLPKYLCRHNEARFLPPNRFRMFAPSPCSSYAFNTTCFVILCKPVCPRVAPMNGFIFVLHHH